MVSIPSRPSGPTPSFVLKNITIDDSDSSLKYSQGWDRSVSSLANGGSFHAGSGVGDVVSFDLPANAVAVYYVGFKQPSGALYEACLDCTAEDTGEVNEIDATSNESSSAEPTFLYGQTDLDPSVPHTFALLNLPNPKTGKYGTITLDAYVVTVQDEVASSVSASSSASYTAPNFDAEAQTSSSSQLPSSASASKTSVSHSATSSVSKSTSTSTVSETSSPSIFFSSSTDSTSSVTSTSSTTASASTTTTVLVAPNADTSDVVTATSASSSASASASAKLTQSNLNTGETLSQRMRSPVVLIAILAATLLVLCTATYALMYFLRRRRRRSKAPRTQISQTAHFFNAIKKGVGEISTGTGRDGVRRSIWTRGAGAGSRGMRDSMAEQLVPDKPQLSPSYASFPSAPSVPREMQQATVGISPYLAYKASRQVPRSVFRPTGMQPGQGPRARSPPLLPVSSVANPGPGAPALQRVPTGAAIGVQLRDPGTAAVPPAVLRPGNSSPSRNVHPYDNPFAVAEAEARARGREQPQVQAQGFGGYDVQRRDSGSSMGSQYSQEGWRRQSPR
ncbi:hypothetical protein M0805_003994 [Coniferiporia weirii]|nr:hypothetical protein M0805_003994 [Coniferiporia weirii]